MIRNETLPIFYGANAFIIEDVYHPGTEGICDTFMTVVMRWLASIGPHVGLFNDFSISCKYSGTEQSHEVVAALTDCVSGLKAEALKAA